jgi:putative transposase
LAIGLTGEGPSLPRTKKVYGSLGVPELRGLRQLREENKKLEHLVADLNLDKTILQEAIRKTC